jgi:hypothetical protein
MEDSELKQKIASLEQKIDSVYQSTEKTRKYFLYTLIATVVVFVLPLIGLMFALPSFFATYSEIMNF